MLLIRKIGLGLLLLMLAGCSLNAKPLTIQEAFDQGLVELEFLSTGTAGGVLTMTATGKTEQAIQLTVPAGLILDNQTLEHEDMVLMNFEGRVASVESKMLESRLPLITKQAKPGYGIIEAYSLEMYAEPGAEADAYEFDGFVDAELQRLVDYLAKQTSDEFMAKQLAIWALTDNPERAAAFDLMEFTDHDLQQARTYLVAAEFEPADYLMFEE